MSIGKIKFTVLLLLIAGCFLFFNSACTSNKKITYFQDVQDSIFQDPETIPVTSYSDPKIQPNDILQISVQTLDPQATSISGTSSIPTFNTQGTTGSGSNNIQGFLVDKNGMIELPLVGKINLNGKTTTEAKEEIRKRASVFYKDPVVNVRFANFNVTVLGEVARPAQYTVAGERVTILDAIGMAGDLTIYGKRENVMVIREESGSKKIIRFDLNSSKIFQNPFFYLRQGDVVYVEANKSKAAVNDVATVRNISILAAITSLIVTVISRINFN